MEVIYFTQLRASRDVVAKKCEDEMERLVEFFNEDHQQHLVARPGKETSATGNIMQRKKVAAHMEDSKCSFSELVKETVEKLGSEGDQITLASARTLVLEIGLRVCFGISKSDADPLEDNTAASLRRWEVRELKLLPPGCREEISELRRRRRKIMDRLASLNNAVELLRAPNKNDISDISAVTKAGEILLETQDEAALRAGKMEWLSKKNLARAPAQQPEVTANVSSPDSANLSQESTKKRGRSDPEERAKLKQEKLMERQRIKGEKEQKRSERDEAEKEKEAEKELKRKEKEEADKKRLGKEAEREQRRREKEEAERKRQEKDAEKEQRKKEKEESERKKQMALKKQAIFMDRFLQTRKEQKEPFIPESRISSDKGRLLANEVQGMPRISTARDSESNHVVTSMDLIFEKNEDYDIDDLRNQHMSSWRESRREIFCSRQGWGSRRKPKTSVLRELRLHGATTSFDVTLKNTSGADSPKGPRAEFEVDTFEDLDLESTMESLPSISSFEAKKLTSDRYVQLLSKRKKLLQFDKCHRPPYYGTYTKRSDIIKPRNPFKKDPELDYQVDSDEEWEEDEVDEGDEPAVTLSDFQNDRDEEEERVENEEEDSADEYMVPDGYLSEGEGVEMEVGTTATERSWVSENSPSDTLPSGISRHRLCRILDEVTEHALRTNRPFIINNLGRYSEEGNSSADPLTRTETLVLEALRMQVVTPTTIGVS